MGFADCLSVVARLIYKTIYFRFLTETKNEI